MAGYAPLSIARDWQIMLVPDHVKVDASLNQQTIQSKIESGLRLTLSRSHEQLIDKQMVFAQCHQKWCGEPSLDSLFTNIRSAAPRVQLVLLYSFTKTDQVQSDYVLHLSLVDPVSFEYRVSEQLTLLDSISETSLVTLGQDAGVLIQNRLRVQPVQHRFDLYFTNFVPEDLDGLVSTTLFNAANLSMTLQTSTQAYTFLEQFMPTIESHYKLESSLNLIQVEQLIARFFQGKIPIKIEFIQSKNQQTQLIVSRKDTPYLVAKINIIIIAILLLMTCGSYIRRRVLVRKLRQYHQMCNADMWLKTYKKARFPLYFLRHKYISEARDWTKLQRESATFANQAKIYLDAGDNHCATLFVNKSLQHNCANKTAANLKYIIQEQVRSKRILSDSEQEINRKVSKAMNRYGQRQPLKALYRLYQAYALAKPQKALKQQATAIKKLINKINKECCASVNAITLHNVKEGTSLFICHQLGVQIGRLPSRSEVFWLNHQQCLFNVNHKAVSKMGQQTNIAHTQGGFVVTDNGSKNGTIINRAACSPNTPYKLTNNELLQLGGSNPVTSVSFKVQVSSQQQILRLYPDTKTTLLDQDELNKVWPNHVLVSQTEVLCTKQAFIFAVDLHTRSLHLCEENSAFSSAQDSSLANKVLSQAESMQPLCIISLGDKASIRPLKEGVDVQINTIRLLGKIPLILPCNLVYQDFSFHIAARLAVLTLFQAVMNLATGRSDITQNKRSRSNEGR